MMAQDARVVHVIDVALHVARAIESVGGRHFVGGCLASSLQGEPGTTTDIDIVLELPLGRTSELVGSLAPDFEVDRDMLKYAVLHGGTCNIFHLPKVMKVDLFAVGPTPYGAHHPPDAPDPDSAPLCRQPTGPANDELAPQFSPTTRRFGLGGHRRSPFDARARSGAAPRTLFFGGVETRGPGAGARG